VRVISSVIGTGLVLVMAWTLAMTSTSQTVSAGSADQLARGKEMFRIRCEPCHGDVGQGLALWRSTWAPEDQKCSQYKCHALNHPPDGFYMPKDAPPIIGEGTLRIFPTARELYGYISKAMPFDKPGELSSDDYWAVTAFLLQQNNKLPTGLELNVTNASNVIINPNLAISTPVPVTSTLSNSPYSFFDGVQWFEVLVVIGLVGLAIVIFLQSKR